MKYRTRPALRGRGGLVNKSPSDPRSDLAGGANGNVSASRPFTGRFTFGQRPSVYQR